MTIGCCVRMKRLSGSSCRRCGECWTGMKGMSIRAMGMLGPMPWWGFVDWADAFGSGMPPGAMDGHSAVISLQYAYTLRQAAELFGYFGGQYAYSAGRCRKLAANLDRGTYRACYDKSKAEMANTPEKSSYSQHAGILAILADAIPAGDRRAVMKKILYDSTLHRQPSISDSI